MMHFIPDCLVPGVFLGKRRQYLKECVSLFLFLHFVQCILIPPMMPAAG